MEGPRRRRTAGGMKRAVGRLVNALLRVVILHVLLHIAWQILKGTFF